MESVQNTTERYNYGQYQKLGGIINEKDYENALLRARNVKSRLSSVAQTKVMARVAGIELTENDPRIALYAVLREDGNLDPKIKYHHSQMSDQRLFAEVLRMLGDVESLQKFIAAHPHIFTERK